VGHKYVKKVSSRTLTLPTTGKNTRDARNV